MGIRRRPWVFGSFLEQTTVYGNRGNGVYDLRESDPTEAPTPSLATVVSAGAFARLATHSTDESQAAHTPVQGTVEFAESSWNRLGFTDLSSSDGQR